VSICEGVLVPPVGLGPDSPRETWVRVCYVSLHPDEHFTSRQLQMTIDHWWPQSQWEVWCCTSKEQALIHKTHRRCQDHQGGRIGGRASSPAKRRGASAGGQVGGPITAAIHESRGYFQSAEFRKIGNRGAAVRDYQSLDWRGVGPHVRWHVNRGIVNQECRLCV
jgi:hypothetical protein